MAQRTFVLGLGAQKAGTTWLHSYISSFEQSNLGAIKEYHVWDVLGSNLCENWRVPHQPQWRMPMPKRIRHSMQNVEGYYEHYFSSILDAGFQITGDISPSYCVLTPDQLSELRRRILSMGAALKVVFLMRDPFERCWSSVRFKFDTEGMKAKGYSDEYILQHKYADIQYEFRTRYEVICENIMRAFRRDEVYFGIYESMFEPEKITEISDFLGVEPKAEHAKVKKNVSASKEGEISQALKEEIWDYYAETYRYCAKYFPSTRELWKR